MPVFGNSPLPMWQMRTRLGSGLRHERFRLVALKLGILMIPRLPDVKPPCLTRRAFGPGFFFLGRAFEQDARRLLGLVNRRVGRSAAGRWEGGLPPAIDVAPTGSHMYFRS